MKSSKKISRRRFLAQANCAAVGSASLFSSLLSLRLTAGAVSGGPLTGYKSLICLFLSGGNDSFNMLMPRQQAAYDEYATVRSTIAHPLANLLPITSTGQSYSEFGLHPDLPFLKTLYDQNNAAFVSNVGTMIEPVSLRQYKAKSKPLPVGLFSHLDERMHWQTFVPQVRGAGPKGWAGRVQECMSQANATGSISMNISLSGNNVLQTGPTSVPYITDSGGAVQLTEYGIDPTSQLAIDNIFSQQYKNLYQSTFAEAHQKYTTAMAFKNAVTPIALTETFPNTQTGNRLKTIAKVMAARGTLSMDRQIFFINRGGWDNHDKVLAKQSNLFTELNDAIQAFWTELGHLGLQDDVVLFTASDFGRKLTSNGTGSDHAWAGNHFVIGGGVNGGKIYGQYPILATGGPFDIGRGRLLPTTSVDSYGAELASWFGVPSSELSTVFPNAKNFFNPYSTPYPLGMLDPLGI
jgi:uncharacterized protein (DUF1501 family)